MWQQFSYQDAHGSHPYSVYTPEHIPFGFPVPLIVMLHGCTQTALDFARGTGMNLLAEQYGFVVLYPQQTRTANQNLCWNWFLPANQQRGSGEPASIVGIIEQMQQNTELWSIDSNRIYVAGISAGAAMAGILGATYPDVFAAIGVHSGLEYQAANSLGQSVKAMRSGGPEPQEQGSAAYAVMGARARVVPTIVFHGTADHVVTPLNGDQVVQQWMQTNDLASNKTYTADYQHPSSMITGQVPGGYAYLAATWNALSGEVVQAYWKIDGMGHAWSGGNPAGSYTDPRGPDATTVLYHFFMDHPMKSTEPGQPVPQVQRWFHRIQRILASKFNPKEEK
jgi:poly(hydroxyalkanoate) depolymerase family esterase